MKREKLAICVAFIAAASCPRLAMAADGEGETSSPPAAPQEPRAEPEIKSDDSSAQRKTAIRISQAVNLAVNGITAGWLVGTKLWVSPLRQDYAFPEYARVQSGLNDTAGGGAPALMTANILANVPPLIMIRDPKRPSFWLHSAGLLMNIALVVTTIAINVPVNDQTSTWKPEQTPPADWMDLRDRWETGHTIRSLLSVGSLISNATAFAFE